MYKLFFILLFGNPSKCYAQEKVGFKIYVGKVNGVNSDSLLTEWSFYQKLGYDRYLELQDITKSGFPIEVRIYERSSLKGFVICSRIYYDEPKNTFAQSLHSTLKYSMLKEKEKYELRTIVKHINADSVFNELVRNGIFSLPAETYDDMPLDSTRMILTPKGLEIAKRQWGSTDGSSYIIIWKVGHQYNLKYFSTQEETELENYPGMDFIKRKKNIVNLLTSEVEMIPKN